MEEFKVQIRGGIDIYTGILEKIIDNAKKEKKKIVLPESSDKRVLEAANIASKEEIANIILIGNYDQIKENKYNIDLDENITIIDPYKSDKTSFYAERLYELRKHKKIKRL